MSSTTVLAFIKDITASNAKAFQDRLKASKSQCTANQRYTDPKEHNLTYSLLHKAADVGCPDIIAALLAAGADVNAADSRGRTPLHWLASSSAAGTVDTAVLMLKQPGINIHALSNVKSTPLHEAAAAGNTAMLQLLLNHGAQPLDSSPGFSTLHAACMGSCHFKPQTAACAEVAGPVLQSQTEAQDSQPAATPPPDQSSAHQVSPELMPPPVVKATTKPGQLLGPTAAGNAGPAGSSGTALKAQVKPRATQQQLQSSLVPHARTPTAQAAAARAPVRVTNTPSSPHAAAAATAAAAAAASIKGKQGPGSARSTTQAAAPVRPSAQLVTAPATSAIVKTRALNQGVLGALLQAAPELLGLQDADGFTPLMRLVQQGQAAEAQLLLARGDCNIHAQAVGTGDTALHLACSCASPDLQLVSALVAAGGDTAAPRLSDGNTPLLLAVKAGGELGLELAKALLQCGPCCTACLTTQQQQQRQQLGQQPGGHQHMQSANNRSTCISANTGGGLDVVNRAGETAVTVAAAAVLGAISDAAAGSSTAAATARAATAQQQLLALLLSQRPRLPQQLAATLLQQGLAGRLLDQLTAQVVTCLPDFASLEVAATAAAADVGTTVGLTTPQQLSYEGLLAVKMYRTAVAWHIKASGKQLCDAVDAAGNTLLHITAAAPDDLPELVQACVDAGAGVNAANNEHDTALHIAARQGHLEVCRALVAAGADVLRRNGKNRAPGAQLKLSEPIKTYLQQAEEEARAAKEDQKHALWDDKMRATQTQSAYGIRVT